MLSEGALSVVETAEGQCGRTSRKKEGRGKLMGSRRDGKLAKADGARRKGTTAQRTANGCSSAGNVREGSVGTRQKWKTKKQEETLGDDEIREGEKTRKGRREEDFI